MKISTVCNVHTLQSDKKYQITGWRPIINNPGKVHHILLMGCPERSAFCEYVSFFLSPFSSSSRFLLLSPFSIFLALTSFPSFPSFSLSLYSFIPYLFKILNVLQECRMDYVRQLPCGTLVTLVSNFLLLLVSLLEMVLLFLLFIIIDYFE